MTNKISMDKTYRTRDGRDVKIYTTEHEGKRPVVGAIGGEVHIWRADGSFSPFINQDHHLDLIEVNPEKVVWVVCHHGSTWVDHSECRARAFKWEHGGTIHRVTLNEDNEVQGV